MEKGIGLEKHTAMRMINVERISDYMVYLLKELVPLLNGYYVSGGKNRLSGVLNVSVPVRACTCLG